MKIGMIGLSHLGLVFTAGFTKLNHKIVAVDKDAKVIAKEIKNNTMKKSLRGFILEEISCLYGVKAKVTPANNAPISAEKFKK